MSHACTFVVLDDERSELWAVVQGLGSCGIPVIPHLIEGARLERAPVERYTGTRFLFTDLHVLGGSHLRLEQHVAALAKFIVELINPTCYVLVFWSKYQEEVSDAQALLNKYLPSELLPFSYEVLAKEDAKNAADPDQSVSGPARQELQNQINAILGRYPQLGAIMDWESLVSKTAAQTVNRLVSTILTKTEDGECSFADAQSVRDVLARMAQEALGSAHALKAPAKGLNLAMLPILQDILERESGSETKRLNQFLAITDDSEIGLPHTGLIPLLNDFFVHAEGAAVQNLDRGAVIRLSDGYLTRPDGLSRDIGLAVTPGDWKETICMEFALNWGAKGQAARDTIKNTLAVNNVYAVELSADCDHAQDKQRSHRFLFALFVPSQDLNSFYSSSKRAAANTSIYVTPELTIAKTKGRLLVSCRVFLARPHGVAVEGIAISRLRKDVVDEVSHHYTNHMRRPGKISFG